MTLKGRMREQTAADGARIQHYHVAPEDVAPGQSRKGGLVLIQEIFGVTDHIKELCDGFAADGYEVIAPALFDRMEPGFTASYSPEDIERSRTLAGRVDWTGVVADVSASVAALAPRGPVFITGYCFGGSVSWVAACRVPGLSAASGYYGRLVIEFVEEMPKCPTILHFGTRDATIPMEWVRQIEATHPEVPVHIYEADHGFNSDRRDQFDAQCAALARTRTLALFDANS